MRNDERMKAVKPSVLLCAGFLILLLLQLFLKMGWGDDVFFAEDVRPLGKFLSERYNGWSSRVLVEMGLKLLAGSPEWIWRILNILIVLLLVWIAADLFGVERDSSKQQAQICFFGLMWSVPMGCIKEAGWIATTLNYLWPVTFGLVAMRPVKHWVKGEKCPVWEYAVCPLCVLFAANTEQCAAVLLGVYLLFGAYLLKENRKLSPFHFLLLGLTAASIVFILTAPGNANRMTLEAADYYPEYGSLNVGQKLLMGFIDTASYYLVAGGAMRNNYLFALLAGILLAGIWQRRTEKCFSGKLLAALFPFLFVWGGAFLRYLLETKGFRRGGRFIGLFCMNRCLPEGAGVFGYFGFIPYSAGEVCLQAGVYLGVLICVIAAIFFLHGKSEETLLELLILGVGLLSRLIMAFSPTIYVSGNRTALICSAAVLIVCLRNLQFFWDKTPARWEKIVMTGYIAGVVGLNYLPTLKI